MCWICDPIRETSRTIEHIGNVIATDSTAQAVTAAAAVAAAAYFSGGLSFGSAAAATTAAEIGATSAASGAAALIPLEAVAIGANSAAVANVVAGAGAASSALTGAQVLAGIKAAGGYAMDGLGVATKVAGGLNALSLVSSRPAPASQFGGSVKSVVPNYGVPSANGAGKAENAKTGGTITAGSVGAGGSAKGKDSALTMLASGLTIAAIVYQFWGNK